MKNINLINAFNQNCIPRSSTITCNISKKPWDKGVFIMTRHEKSKKELSKVFFQTKKTFVRLKIKTYFSITYAKLKRKPKSSGFLPNQTNDSTSNVQSWKGCCPGPAPHQLWSHQNVHSDPHFYGCNDLHTCFQDSQLGYKRPLNH